jgi:PAS domain S-box-containing protein
VASEINNRHSSESETNPQGSLGEEGDYQKYASLLNTLKGHEEFTLNQDGIIISSNLEVANVTGYEEHEIIGKHISIFYPADEQAKAAQDLVRAVKLGKTIVAGLRIKKRNASFWAKMKITALVQENSLMGFKVILKDGTHRALSNLRVRTIRDEYLAIFNNPFIGSFKFRLVDGLLLQNNLKFAQITGISDFTHTSFQNLFYEPPHYHDFVHQLRNQNKLEGYEFRLQSIDNKPRWGSISCRMFQSTNFVEGILNDITQIKNQFHELERVNAELDQFIYHASHDLRSPLTTMLGLTQLIRMEKAIEPIWQCNDMMEERILHLDGLLRDLVAIAWNNQQRMENEKVTADDLCIPIQEFRILYPETTIDFVEAANESFFSDGIRLKTILTKLLSNAQRYKTIQPVHVSVYFRTTKELAVIRLVDNSSGIHPKFHHRVFDLFFQGTQNKGTGLDLYIVKALVDKLGGEIKFESSPQVGSAFSITIPNRGTLTSQ